MAHRASTGAAAVAVLGVLVAGVLGGTYVASDTDPYGYVSQADAIARGSLLVDQRTLLAGLTWPGVDESLIPAGWVSGPVRGLMAPMYASGLPLTMAALQRATGRRKAVFHAVPILGALAVWMTFVLGTRVHSPLTGALAAVLVATSPSFLYQIVQPVSDVPAMAWWTMSLALALGDRRWSAVGAGAAASMAVLTRPNLLPLAGVIGAWLAWHATRSAGQGQHAVARAVLFPFALAPGCLGVAAINQHLYGSPLQSGYGPIRELFAWSNVPLNLDRYPRWLVQTETPFILLGLLAPLVARGRQPARVPPLRTDHVWLLLAFAAANVVFYLFYGWFGRDEWGYLRFLLPAFPPLLVLSVAVLTEGARTAVSRFSRTGTSLAISISRTIAATTIAIVAVFAAWLARESVVRGAFDVARAERRYLDVAQHIAASLPPNTAVIAGLHSGSVRYHADRLSVYYPRLYWRSLDQAIERLRARGFHPVILLEEGERPEFEGRFAEFSPLAALDWPPLYEGAGSVRVWDPAAREP